MENLLKNKEHKHLEYDIKSLVNDFENDHFDMGRGFEEDGTYFEYFDNTDMKHLIEDVYQIKEDFKAFVESKEMAHQFELDMATFDNEHFQTMFGYLQDDLDIHSCEEL